MANKEYHNFKEFISVVLSHVDSKGRFIWANCGIPGNTHDSFLQIVATVRKNIEEGHNSRPSVLLMKPYTNAIRF